MQIKSLRRPAGRLKLLKKNNVIIRNVVSGIHKPKRKE
jgi:hypothetical protein